MAGSNAVGFGDFVLATSEAMIGGPDDFIVEFVNRNYVTDFLYQTDPILEKEMVQGGEKIRVDSVFQTSGQARTYKFGAPANIGNPQRLKSVEIPWRACRVPIVYNDAEIKLNDRLKFGNDDVRIAEFTRMAKVKRSIALGDKLNLMESLFLSVPDKAKQEALDPSGDADPYSMFAAINEDTNGLFNPRDGNVWTVFEGRDPTDTAFAGKWANQLETYTSADPAGANNNATIIGAFQRAFPKLMIKSPKLFGEYWTNPQLASIKILTSMFGESAFANLLRVEQNLYAAGKQDPAYMHPSFAGVPIVGIDLLDSVAVYNAGGSALGAERGSSTTNKGPRYYIPNGAFFYPVFHDEVYWEFEPEMSDVNQPDMHVIWVVTWFNNVCSSRWRHGMISPTGGAVYS